MVPEACLAMDAKKQYDAVVAQKLNNVILPINSFGGDTKSLGVKVTATFTNPAVTLKNPCGDGKNYELPGSTFTMDGQLSNNAMTRSTPVVQWPCTTGKQYTLMLYDAGHFPVKSSPGSGPDAGPGGYLHWLRINIPCAAGGMASATGGADFSATGTGFFTPGNPETIPHNYGFYIYEQASTITPTVNDTRAFVRMSFSPAAWLNRYLAEIPSQVPIARTWANLVGSIWSANLFVNIVGGDFAPWGMMACKNLCYIDDKSGTCAPKTITQTVTFTGFAPSQFVGALKTLLENAYGVTLGIYDIAGTKWSTDCSVAATATTVTRRGVATSAVTFVAQVSKQKSSVATSAAKLLSAAFINDAVAAVKAGDTGTFGTVSAPTATTVAAPVIATKSTPSGSSSDDDGMATWLIVLIAVLAVLVVALALYLVCRNKAHEPDKTVVVKDFDTGEERVADPSKLSSAEQVIVL
jgi:hypothetical protein